MKKVERKQFYYRDFYRIADGRYASYWAGKFNNTLMSSGHKRTAELQAEKAFTYIKTQYRLVPLEMLLESLEKVKPTFNLNYIIVSGRKREFPVFLAPHKRLRLSVR
jgi:ribosomal protein S7